MKNFITFCLILCSVFIFAQDQSSVFTNLNGSSITINLGEIKFVYPDGSGSEIVYRNRRQKRRVTEDPLTILAAGSNYFCSFTSVKTGGTVLINRSHVSFAVVEGSGTRIDFRDGKNTLDVTDAYATVNSCITSVFSGGGGGGNLAYTPAVNQGTVTNTGGTDAIIPLVQPSSGANTAGLAPPSLLDNVNALVDLTGLPAGTLNLGSFTGTTFADNLDIKPLFQVIETLLEGNNLDVVLSKGGSLTAARTIDMGGQTLAITNRPAIDSDSGDRILSINNSNGEIGELSPLTYAVLEGGGDPTSAIEAYRQSQLYIDNTGPALWRATTASSNPDGDSNDSAWEEFPLGSAPLTFTCGATIETGEAVYRSTDTDLALADASSQLKAQYVVVDKVGSTCTVVVDGGDPVALTKPDGNYFLGEDGAMTVTIPSSNRQYLGQVLNNVFQPDLEPFFVEGFGGSGSSGANDTCYVVPITGGNAGSELWVCASNAGVTASFAANRLTVVSTTGIRVRSANWLIAAADVQAAADGGGVTNWVQVEFTGTFGNTGLTSLRVPTVGKTAIPTTGALSVSNPASFDIDNNPAISVIGVGGGAVTLRAGGLVVGAQGYELTFTGVN